MWVRVWYTNDIFLALRESERLKKLLTKSNDKAYVMNTYMVASTIARSTMHYEMYGTRLSSGIG